MAEIFVYFGDCFFYAVVDWLGFDRPWLEFAAGEKPVNDAAEEIDTAGYVENDFPFVRRLKIKTPPTLQYKENNCLLGTSSENLELPIDFLLSENIFIVLSKNREYLVVVTVKITDLS